LVRPASNAVNQRRKRAKLIRRQLGNSFGDFFDFHVVQYSTAEAWLSDGKGFGARPPTVLGQVSSVPNQVIAAAHDLGADRERGLWRSLAGLTCQFQVLSLCSGKNFFSPKRR
jgi:hypothetical protein